VWTTGGRVFEAVEGEVPRDDPNDPYRRFVRQVMGAAAELERGMVTARLQGGRRRKHAQGGYAGGPTVPIGKRVEGQGKAAKLVDDPDTRPVVERVITLRADGLTLREVAETLNAEGITGVRGGRWYPASVQRVLRREADRS
jgi:DNA invertase Pin-like site-specific DNA recombinase